MSWFATKYAWRCSHEDIKGSVKLLLLAIAYLIPQGRLETEPVSIGALEQLTGLEDRQVRRCRDTLIATGELARAGTGKLARYTLPKMAGPLFATVTNPDKLSGLRGARWRRNPDKLSESEADKMSGKTRTSCPTASSSHPCSGSVRTEDLCTTTAKAEAAAVEAFCDWFITEYPKHRRGALYTVDPAAAEVVVRELLQGRTLERLKAMARRMWSEREDSWILASDYSLYVLRHRATYLDIQVADESIVERETSASSVWDELLVRVEPHVGRHAFFTWLRPLRLAEDRGAVVVLDAPSDTYVHWVPKHYGEVLRRELADIRPGAEILVRVAASEATA